MGLSRGLGHPISPGKMASIVANQREGHDVLKRNTSGHFEIKLRYYFSAYAKQPTGHRCFLQPCKRHKQLIHTSIFSSPRTMHKKDSRQVIRSTSATNHRSQSADRHENGDEERSDHRRNTRRKETLGYRLDLEEPLPQPSRNTTLSISKPVIRIEREESPHSANDTNAFYRISTAFVLHITINDFNQRWAINLRYPGLHTVD